MSRQTKEWALDALAQLVQRQVTRRTIDVLESFGKHEEGCYDV
jgi:hypothetical protein